MEKTNDIIRDELKKNNVKQWELAEKLGYSDSWFCVKMREEIEGDFLLRILHAIDDIAAERRQETIQSMIETKIEKPKKEIRSEKPCYCILIKQNPERFQWRGWKYCPVCGRKL